MTTYENNEIQWVSLMDKLKSEHNDRIITGDIINANDYIHVKYITPNLKEETQNDK